MKKVCVFTGTRAEYGLLKPLMEGIADDVELDLQVIVSGTHLSPEFGFTYKEIEADGFTISEKVEVVLSSDSPLGVAKSMGLGIIGYAEAQERLKPDMLLLLGDRYEAVAAALAATVLRIPIAHLYGGEITLGAIDDAFRHAITKMSLIHFTATEAYRNRVIQLGEAPERVFNVGAIGVENIHTLPLLSKVELFDRINCPAVDHYALITCHPETAEKTDIQKDFGEILAALEDSGLFCIFTKSNADAGGRAINAMIETYVASHAQTSRAYASLGQIRYLSLLKYARCVVGNSSSGIVEAPSLRIPCINVGDRQKGRASCDAVIHCRAERSAVGRALRTALSPSFAQVMATTRNPYEKAHTTQTILKIIERFDSANMGMKAFHDITGVWNPKVENLI
ncbi:MAG: UDP-N-acetylglucosamine 2-epimerase [Desulfatitalea sp. BRH_c12]|nr:MAG: UDP-N-acetylglucosamine 2-epimerase [Desulfatitalea sp. BRH_c12]